MKYLNNIIFYNFRYWLLKKLIGERSIIFNTKIDKGTLTIRDREVYFHNVSVNIDSRELNEDVYEWFYPSAPPPYAIKIEGI